MISTLQKTGLLIACVIFFLSFSTNPPNGKTGAPGEGVCAECHNPISNSITGSIEILGLPNVITPNSTYSLTVRTTLSDGASTRAGFQMVALNSSNFNAGSMDNTGDNAAITVEAGRTYVEHAPAKSFGSDDFVEWTVDWTAPDGPVGDSIAFYASGILANGTGSSGDRLLLTNNKVLMDMESNIEESLEDKISINTFPNPTSDILNVTINENVVADKIILSNAYGEIVFNQEQPQNNTRINTSDYSTGIYYVSVYSKDNIATSTILVTR